MVYLKIFLAKHVVNIIENILKKKQLVWFFIIIFDLN